MNLLTINIICLIVIISSSILLFFWFKHLRIKIKLTNKLIIIYSSILILLAGTSSFLLYYFEPPKLELIGEKEVKIVLNENYKEEGIKATWHNKDITKKVKITNSIDNTKIGSYKIEYKINYNDKDYIINRIINVIDEIAPEITFTDDKDLTICPNKSYLDLGYQATDNYDGDITSNVVITKEVIDDNHYNLVYNVKDNSGNETNIVRNMTVKDEEKPVITLTGKANRNLVKGVSYKEAGYTAYDSCDGNITNRVTVSGSVNSNEIGTYTLTYKVKDSAGHEDVAYRKISVINPDVSKNIIYLTFDDGPSGTITPKILDILKEENVHATFFLVDFDSSKNYIVQRMVNEGHTVGIHGKSHTYKEIYKSVDSYMYNIEYMNNKIKKLTGIDSRITRFPGGSSNTVSRFNPGIMTTLTSEVVARGYSYFDWNVDSNDAGGTKTSSGIYNNVTSHLKYNRANVVLMHDLNNKTYTAGALKDIITFGKENGYSFKNITESTPMVTMRVNN